MMKFALTLAALLLAPLAALNAAEVANLRCEYRENPLGKDQGDLWDSGKVALDQSIQVEYKHNT